MRADAIRAALEAVARGETDVESALAELQGVVDLGFATVDVDRARRRGVPEVILGSGKSAEQIVGIAAALRGRGQRVLVTRVDPSLAQAVQAGLPEAAYEAEARCLWAPATEPPITGRGTIVVASAGTSDWRVAAEAARTARLCGNAVERINDIGVAGLHRLLSKVDRLRAAAVIIVCAGMDGALPGVVAGLVDRPVIGVPTSIGYGVAANGHAALNTMLSACAAGLTVVNIDNGFGAAYAATLINRALEVER